MHTIFESIGTLRPITDYDGNPIEHDRFIRNVIARAKYELKPSPHQSFVLEIYGYDLIGFGAGKWTEELTLENGLVFRGKCSGGGMRRSGAPPEIRKVQMHDVWVESEETARSTIILNPSERPSPPRNNEIDAAVFGVVGNTSLGSNGVARPGFPFSHRKTFPDQGEPGNGLLWSTQALRLYYGDLEITFVGTSRYWKKLVDSKSLLHDKLVGVRRKDGKVLSWDEFAGVADMLSQFIGWLGHCTSPVYHVKGYRRGKLVYRAYDLYPHPSVHRDRHSWMPIKNIPVQELFDGFVNVWKRNIQERGTFHIAMQLLRSREKGSPLGRPSIGYLRDTFTACAILEQMLTGRSSKSGRQAQIARCLKEISVADKLPHLAQQELNEVGKNAQLWRAAKSGVIQVQEQADRTLSRPLANMENWLLHVDDPDNARRLLTLPRWVQHYLLEVSMWLADLMMLKVVGYNDEYINKLAGKTESVPWVDVC